MTLEALGIDTLVLAGIIGLTAVIKWRDKKQRFKRFYVLIPLLLGIAAAFFLTQPLTWQGVGRNAIIYAGVAAYLYDFKKVVTVSGAVIDPNGGTP